MNTLFSLENKRALITGSGRGIGFLMAKGLAEAGAEVIVNATTQHGAERTATQLRALGYTAQTVSFDITQSEPVIAAIEHIECSFGPIDILINNAGIQRRHPILDFPEGAWNEVISVNQTAVFLLYQAVARKMKIRNQGKIINIGSMQSKLGRDTITPDAACKDAVKMLTRGMCVELARYNIQVNCIAPGYCKTEMTEALANDEAFTGWLYKRTPAPVGVILKS